MVDSPPAGRVRLPLEGLLPSKQETSIKGGGDVEVSLIRVRTSLTPVEV